MTLSGRAGHAFIVDDNDFAILDLADKFCADEIKRAGFRGQNPAAADLAEHEWTQADRVAGTDQFLVGQADKGVAAFDLGDRIHEPVAHQGLGAACDKLEDDFGVHRGLEDRALLDQVAAHGTGIGQIAIVGDREAGRGEVCEDRLDVAQRGLALGRVAVVADGICTGQAGRQIAAEILADEAHMAFVVELLAIICGDAAGFLSAMLEGVQAERHEE